MMLELPTVSSQNGRPILVGDLLAQRLVEDREERLGTRRRQRVRRHDVDLQRQPVLRDADDVGVVVAVRIALGHVDDRRDVADHRLRQALRHRLPMALHEDEGDDRLQQDHRRDDDDQRARVEPLRHVARDQPPEAVPVLGERDVDRQLARSARTPPNRRSTAASRARPAVNLAGAKVRVSRPASVGLSWLVSEAAMPSFPAPTTSLACVGCRPFYSTLSRSETAFEIQAVALSNTGILAIENKALFAGLSNSDLLVYGSGRDHVSSTRSTASVLVGATGQAGLNLDFFVLYWLPDPSRWLLRMDRWGTRRTR